MDNDNQPLNNETPQASPVETKSETKKDRKFAIVITILLSIFILLPIMIGLMMGLVGFGMRGGIFAIVVGFGGALLVLVGGIFLHRAIYRGLLKSL